MNPNKILMMLRFCFLKNLHIIMSELNNMKKKNVFNISTSLCVLRMRIQIILSIGVAVCVHRFI